MVNHGLSTGALFLLVGMIYERRHTRQIAELGGLQKPAPSWPPSSLVVMLSSIGLPGLNGFVGEFLILLGSFLTRRWWAVVGAVGRRSSPPSTCCGPTSGSSTARPRSENADMPDLVPREVAVHGARSWPLIVFLGVYPKPVLERIEPSVDG